MIVLVSNSRDFATDFVVVELLRRRVPYYRIDIDLLPEDSVMLDPVERVLTIESGGKLVRIAGTDIVSLLYRAPTFLRESASSRRPPTELLQRHQWAAFARSLMIFDDIVWVNHPRNVYAAECKPLQLLHASRVGFRVAPTIVCNNACRDTQVWDSGGRAAVKALDAFLLRLEDTDAFFYTHEMTLDEATPERLAAMPVILQRYLRGKLDIRVTVVGQQVFSASVSRNGAAIEGDWRLAKNEATFTAHELPEEVVQRCLALNKSLGLLYGAIDLALVDDTYYFLEVNPTGEWAWLIEPTGHRIDRAMADVLCGPRA